MFTTFDRYLLGRLLHTFIVFLVATYGLYIVIDLFTNIDAFQMEAQNAANQYGFNVLDAQGAAGAEQRAIESEGMKADYAQFAEERKYPYTQVQYMQSLLQGLPLEAQSTSYTQPSQASQTASTIEGLGALYKKLFGGGE